MSGDLIITYPKPYSIYLRGTITWLGFSEPSSKSFPSGKVPAVSRQIRPAQSLYFGKDSWFPKHHPARSFSTNAKVMDVVSLGVLAGNGGEKNPQKNRSPWMRLSITQMTFTQRWCPVATVAKKWIPKRPLVDCHTSPQTRVQPMNRGTCELGQGLRGRPARKHLLSATSLITRNRGLHPFYGPR